jgi:hypothetical protein
MSFNTLKYILNDYVIFIIITRKYILPQVAYVSQTIQWLKEKELKDKQRSTTHTHITGEKIE